MLVSEILKHNVQNPESENTIRKTDRQSLGNPLLVTLGSNIAYLN